MGVVWVGVGWLGMGWGGWVWGGVGWVGMDHAPASLPLHIPAQNSLYACAFKVGCRGS